MALFDNWTGHRDERQGQKDAWAEQQAYQARVDEANRQNAFKATIATITGEPPTAEELAKYAQYIDQPAILEAVVRKDFALRPAKGTYAKDINSELMSKLGREATASELNYFGKQMEQGNLDTYGLQSFIKSTEEFQTNYTKKARTDLTAELGATDQEYLNKVDKSLQAKYAGQGRSGAGAFGSAMITAGKDLANERGSYLANIGYQNAQQGVDTLKGQYQQNLNQMYTSQQQNQNFANESRNRYYSQADYNRGVQGQQNLMGLQDMYTRRSQPSFMEGLAPGLVSALAQILAPKK
jgi:hypothetical protein